MKNQLNIVLASVYHVSNYYSGNENYFHNLAVGLSELGHRVTYLCAFGEQGDYPYELKIVNVPMMMGKPLPSPSWTSTVVGLRPDIFHASGSGLPLAVSAMMLKHSYNVPTVLTFQGPLRPDNLIMQTAAVGEMYMAGRAFDQAITTGPDNATLLKSVWPWMKVKMVPMMLSEIFFRRLPSAAAARKRLKLDPSRPTVLFVGRLDTHHYYKGVDYLLEAATLLPQEYQVMIIGEGNTRQEYEKKVLEMGLEDKVKLLGFVETEVIRDYMVASDVFVLPSTSQSEGFGLVLIEAMACNTPVVMTSAIGSASWFKKEKVSALIPPRDSQALSKAIVEQAEHPDKEQISRGRNFARSFTREQMAKDTVAFYEDLLVEKNK